MHIKSAIVGGLTALVAVAIAFRVDALRSFITNGKV